METEFYWVLKSPAPLAGMRYPRSDFPWSRLKSAGFSRVVFFHPGSYNPLPLATAFVGKLEDLAHGGPPSDARRETDLIKQAVAVSASALGAGEGVVVQCAGGRGRTGTVLGCILRELGYEAELIVAYLDRVHKARGKPGWPESPWQSEFVRAWRSDG
jgi:hypothetical protein